MRIVHRSRLLDCIKSCCYIERYSPLDLFEPAERGKKNSATSGPSIAGLKNDQEES